MEMIAGDFSKLPVWPVADDINKLPLSVQTVVSNDDLLSEILLWLPAIVLLLFKSVSKGWLSVIQDTNFIKRRSQIPKIDPSSGFFIMRNHYEYDPSDFGRYDFLRFDTRIQVCRSQLKTTFKIGSEAGINAFVVQSCNGLLLCHAYAQDKYCVYNPSTHLSKLLPQPPHMLPDTYIRCGLRMAFDPTISPYYKVVYAGTITDISSIMWWRDKIDVVIQIQTYSSQTGNWAVVRGGPFPSTCFSGFHNGIYWDGAIHWLTEFSGCWYMHYKLDFANEHPTLTNVQLPGTLNNADMDHDLFESGGCLLLFGMDKTHSLQLNVYKMRNGYSGWSFNHFVNVCDIMTPVSGRKSIRIIVSCIAVGEREEDLCMVITLGKKTFQYNFALKTSRDLSDLNLDLPVKCYSFAASFASV